MLRNLILELKQKDILFAVAGATGPVRDILFKSKLSEDVTEELMFAKVHKAIECLNSEKYKDSHKKSKKIALQRN